MSLNIRKTEVWTFEVPFQQGTVALSVSATSQEQAAQVIKDWMQGVQQELALEFPKIAPPTAVATPTTLNALQIGLISDMVNAIPGYDGTLDMPTLTKAVKKLTKLELTLENFKDILPLLEKQKNG